MIRPRSALRRLPLAVAAVVLAAAGDGAAQEQRASRIRFAEVGATAGIQHVHSTRRFTGRPKHQVLEMFTAGGAAVAVADVDGDGWEDVLLVDSDLGKPHRLFRNLGGWRFEEVGAAAGVTGGNDEHSIVADALFIDVDNDGWQDLVLGRFGLPILLRNEADPGGGGLGGRRFVDVSSAMGLDGFANSIAVIAFDADADGFLDLLSGNYFPPANLLALDDPHVLPEDLDDAHNGGGLTFWHNVTGEGGARKFVDETAARGLAGHTGWSLDLGHADLDNDGDQDVYVAGDYGTDRLFWNRGDGTFVDGTEEAIGFDTRKGMNVDVADVDRDGWLDIYVTNITDDYMRECNMLWHNNGDGTFLDLSRETGTCDTDWGWAAKFADLDADGWEDLFVVDGLRSAGPEEYIPVLLEMIITPGIDFSDLHSYPDIGERSWSGFQKQRLFHNLGDGTFREIGADAGLDNDLDGRGIGVADLDRDGRLDLVQTAANQPALVFRNDSEGVGHWLGIELVGSGGASNRDAIGARVTVRTASGTQIREVNGGNGYASQSTRALYFGLGSDDRVLEVAIRWPDGRRQRWLAPPAASAVPIDRWLGLR